MIQPLGIGNGGMTWRAGRELREIGALGDAPVAIEPGPHALRRADTLQAIDIAGIGFEQGRIVADLGRNEDAREARLGIDHDIVGSVVDEHLLDRMVRRAAGIAADLELPVDALRRPQRRQQRHDRIERVQLGQLVEIDPGQAPALEIGRVALVLQIGADQLGAIRELEGIALLRIAGRICRTCAWRGR